MSQSRPRLLVADDEPVILELLAASLSHAGFEVLTAPDGRQALQLARQERPDALILDVMMPAPDGLAVVRRLRSEGNQTPALFLTARAETEDTVAGLAAGGDDYVTKPFKLAEVIARIHALLRRAGGHQNQTDRSEVHAGDVSVDLARHRVTRAGVAVDLTPTEFRLLSLFVTNSELVLSKQQILAQVWEYDFGGDANIVETYISYLRRKLNDDHSYIDTVRGVGYRFVPRPGVP